MAGDGRGSVPKYAEKLAWLESLEVESPDGQRGRRLATRFWAGLWPVSLAVLIVLAIWQGGPLRGRKNKVLPGPPVAIILFGINTSAILFVIILGAAPSIANGLIAGVDYTPPLLLKAGAMMGLRRLSLYRHLILPASLPALVAGLRQGWAFAWRSLMAGELLVIIANEPSLGVLLSTDQDQSDMASATAIIIVILVLGILVHTLFSMADRSIRRRWGLIGTT